MNVTEYFDLEQVFVNELVGNVWLFVFMGIIIIWYYCIKSKLDMQIPLVASLLFAGICFSISYNTLLILWVLVIITSGFIFYYGISQILK